MANLKAASRVEATCGSKPLGPAIPHKLLTEMDEPSSLIVGIWGQLGNRESVATAKIRNFPPLTRAAVPAMKEEKFGRIIVIASSAGLIGEPNVSAYTAAKHGVIGLVRAAAAELGKYGITVNAVCPSYVDTPMTKRSLEAAAARTGKDFNEVKAALEAKQPSGRFLTPSEVASAAIAFIDLPNTTGQAEILKGE